MKVVSLFDRTGNAVKPWADAGYECHLFDIQNEDTVEGNIHKHHYDLNDMPPVFDNVAFVCAFPPCTHLSVSGARWMKGKGLGKLEESIRFFKIASRYCELAGAPYYIENPMSTISSYWREPDYKFHPCHYTAFELDDNYRKETWLWTGHGFVMPPPAQDTLEPPDNRIHEMAPSDERGDLRSATPMGFSRAVFEVNNDNNR